MPLLDVPLLACLQEEFRLSMKRLLSDLCLDLESQYADVAKSLGLPVAYFRFLGQALERDAYAHWKVVGWIEALNDLVYFIDLLQQIREEQNPREFAAQLFAECEEKFFENSYLDDLFPRGVSQASGLERRLNELCKRLTQELTQESLCLVPGLPMLWCASRKIQSWTIEIHLGHNVERAELFGTMAMGMEGDIYEAPPSVKRALKQSSGQATILIRPRELSLEDRTNRDASVYEERQSIGMELGAPATCRGNGGSIWGRHSRADARLWEGSPASDCGCHLSRAGHANRAGLDSRSRGLAGRTGGARTLDRSDHSAQGQGRRQFQLPPPARTILY